eukprot:gnl/MRDRNA2_/MRDRNA2_210839_c0_seq1.p2 gnl/MRDRNA2_/MRDRNA2_210839_c0~~gnl/MRDRNA2_/MRDRNA2_210839_c0_seq1.p2  ORF type:complete len:389 (-),score=61.51 gnl/MRDRNA2_/MRDRNA2_210839_c0_seq1:375-1421(-)
MIVETWVLPMLFSASGSFSQLSTLRLLRLLRISRIFRMVPELGMMVKSMIAAVRSVSSTFLLAVGIMYVFAIILTQWAKGIEMPEEEVVPDGDVSEALNVPNLSMVMNVSGLTKCEPIGEEEEEPSTEEQLIEAWGTIPRSLLSLMQILVFDDTFSLIRTTMLLNFSLGFLLIFFILVASFIVLIVLIGVIWEILSSATADEKEELLQAKVEEMEDIFQQTDPEIHKEARRKKQKKFGWISLLKDVIKKLQKEFDVKPRMSSLPRKLIGRKFQCLGRKRGKEKSVHLRFEHQTLQVSSSGTGPLDAGGVFDAAFLLSSRWISQKLGLIPMVALGQLALGGEPDLGRER